MLLEKGVAQCNIDSHLTVTQGDVPNVENCRDALIRNGRTADNIISGVGAAHSLQQCGENQFLRAANPETPLRRLLFVAISSTGISTTSPRDVPLLLVPLYHLMLANAYKDKKNMEAAVLEHAESTNSVISGYVLVRPTLLKNEKWQGGQKVKVGSHEKPKVGYMISRNDVGLWCLRIWCSATRVSALGRSHPSHTEEGEIWRGSLRTGTEIMAFISLQI